MFPLAFNLNMVSLIANYYGYEIFNSSIGVVYDTENYQLKIWENIPEFNLAIQIYLNWYEKGYLKEAMHNIDFDSNIIASGKFPLTIGGLDKLIQMNNLAYQNEVSWRYNGFPLVSNTIKTKNILDGYSLAISSNCKNPERVLMLIEWIHSSQVIMIYLTMECMEKIILWKMNIYNHQRILFILIYFSLEIEIIY